MPYYYENHLSGNWYSTDHKQTSKQLYCDECGDHDWYIGFFENDEEFKQSEYYKLYFPGNDTEQPTDNLYHEQDYSDIPETHVNINKYNLTPKNIVNLHVDRSKVNEENGFWYNNAINAWCLSGSVGVDDYPICDATEYWLGVYDKPKKDGSVKIALHFSCYSGMCNYKFDTFFDEKEMETEDDYRIQYRFIDVMNKLIEKGVFIIQ